MWMLLALMVNIAEPLPAIALLQASVISSGDQLLQRGLQQLQAHQLEEARQTLQQALLLYQQQKNRAGEGQAWKALGNVEYAAQQYDRAIAAQQHALEIAQEIQDQDLAARALLNLGNIARAQEHFAQSIQWYQRCLTLAEAVGLSEIVPKGLAGLGRSLYQLRQYEAAIAALQRAETLAKDIDDQGTQSFALMTLGSIAELRGEPERALSIYQQAWSIVRHLGHPSAELVATLAIASTAYGSQRYDLALDYGQQGLLLARQLQDQEQEMTALSLLAISHVGRGEPQRALDFYQQQRRVAQQLGNKTQEADIISRIGITYLALGDYLKALMAYQEVGQLAQTLGEPLLAARAIGEQANVYLALGAPLTARQLYQQQFTLAETQGNSELMTIALENLGDLEIYLSQYDRAIVFYQRGLALLTPRSSQRPRLLNRLSNSYAYLQNYLSAWDYGQQALAEAKLQKNSWETWQALRLLGQVALEQQDPQAIELFQQALALSPQLKVKTDAIIWANLGAAYLMLQRYEQATAAFQTSLQQAQHYQDPEGQGLALEGLGATFFAQGQLSSAEQAFTQAIALWESQRARLGREDAFKVSLFERQAATYRHLQQVLVAQGKFTTALEVAERGRARAFVELLQQRLQVGLGVTQPTPQEPPVPTIDQIRAIARQQKATLVEYSLIPELAELWIWVIQPTGEVDFRRASLRNLTRPLVELVSRSRETIGVQGRGLSFQEPAASRVAITPGLGISNQPRHYLLLQELHRLLIDPIADLLPQQPEQRVIFLPQGVLFLVPFAALQSNTGQYLIQKHTLLTAPSIQVLQFTHQMHRRSPAQPPNILIVGNPTMPQVGDPPLRLSSLPGAEQEARTIAHLLNAQAVLGAAATETAVVARMQNAQVIHLATHGLLDDLKELGMPGAIALAPSLQTRTVSHPLSEPMLDGLLTASEILSLNLQAELVVLSACDTGRGRITGDGVVGLTRAFIAAGTPSIVVSLWAVSDESTAFLMQEFYRLQYGSSPARPRLRDRAAALRQAMLATQKAYPEPQDWAAFTLVGEAEF